MRRIDNRIISDFEKPCSEGIRHFTMAKTLVLLVGCIAFCSSARAEYEFRTSEGNETVAFRLQNGSTIILAFWTSDTNPSFTIEVEKASVWKDDWPYQDKNSPIEPKMWHLFWISLVNSMVRLSLPLKDVEIDPMVKNVTIIIRSSKRIHWQHCPDIHSCYLPMAEGCTELALAISVPICCVCVTVVITLAVYFTQGKKSPVNDSGQNNKEEEPFYEDVALPSIQKGNTETINPLYVSVSHGVWSGNMVTEDGHRRW
ncbi:uncharacterized protein LOC135226076 [Macrobrachium nipponense]|uniref:uncharacterized protein LOC135226076 n=1 Tax=Macrobrachium nipponense TaxID=159736 RepID=UPI0030C83336